MFQISNGDIGGRVVQPSTNDLNLCPGIYHMYQRLYKPTSDKAFHRPSSLYSRPYFPMVKI